MQFWKKSDSCKFIFSVQFNVTQVNSKKESGVVRESGRGVGGGGGIGGRGVGGGGSR